MGFWIIWLINIYKFMRMRPGLLGRTKPEGRCRSVYKGDLHTSTPIDVARGRRMPLDYDPAIVGWWKKQGQPVIAERSAALTMHLDDNRVGCRSAPA